MQVGASNITALRFVFQSFLVIPLIFKDSEDMVETTKMEWLLIFASSLFICASGLLAYLSLMYIPLMNATVLFMSQPIYVLFLSRLFLGTRISLLDIIMTAIAFTGVIFICQPSFLFGITTSQLISPESWKGYLMATGNLILAGNANCVVRKLKHRSTVVILIIQAISALPLMLLYDYVTKSAHDPQTPGEWLELFLTVFFSSVARILVTTALKYEQVHSVSVISSLEIVLSAFFQIGMFGIYPNALGYIGAIFVMLGIIGIALKSKIGILFKNCRMYFVKNKGEFETMIVAEKS